MDLVPTQSTLSLADSAVIIANFQAISKWSKDAASKLNSLGERVESTVTIVVRLEQTEAARAKREEETEARLLKLEEEVRAKQAAAEEGKAKVEQETSTATLESRDKDGNTGLVESELSKCFDLVRAIKRSQSAEDAAREEEMDLLRKKLAESKEAAAKTRKEYDDQILVYKDAVHEMRLASEKQSDELVSQLARRGADLAVSNAKLAVAEEALEKLVAALTGLDGPCIPRYVERSGHLNKTAHGMGCPVLDSEAEVYRNAVMRLVDGQVNNIGYDRKHVTKVRVERITLQEKCDSLSAQLAEKTEALRKAEVELTREKDELLVQTKCSEVAQEERWKLQAAYEAMAAEKASVARELKLALAGQEVMRVHSVDYLSAQEQNRILTGRCAELEKKLADLTTETAEREKGWEMTVNTWSRRYYTVMGLYGNALRLIPENALIAPATIAGATLIASPNPPVLVNPDDFRWVRATDVPASAAADSLGVGQADCKEKPSAAAKGKERDL